MKRIKDRHTFQVSSNTLSEVRETIEDQIRSSILCLIHDLFEEELLELCGRRYSRHRDTLYQRAGSDKGSVLAQGQRLQVRKPRVKKSGHEVRLKSYSALQGYDILCDRVLRHAMSGVSSRNYSHLLDDISGGIGLSKSSVSRAFNKSSKQALESINHRDLSECRFSAIMIDGVSFGSRMVIVALGITDKGKKVVLGLREGNTESWEVCRDLLEALIDRGLDKEKGYLFVIDGSKALRKGIDRVFSGRSVVQRCIHHKERNILSYLPQGRHIEFKRRWKRLHGLTDEMSSKLEYESLLSWLKRINHSAFTSLKEAEMETLTTIKLGVSLLLRKSLSSTNPIESVFSVVRDKVRRVKNWRSSPDQVLRWSAVTLLEAEKHFRSVKGFKDLEQLEQNLKKILIDKKKKQVKANL